MDEPSKYARIRAWADNPTPDSVSQLGHALHEPSTACAALFALKIVNTDESAQAAVDFLANNGQRTADDAGKLYAKINPKLHGRMFRAFYDQYGDMPLSVWLVSELAATPDEYADFLAWRAGLKPHLITVVNLDDEPLSRDLYRLMTCLAGDMLVVGEAGDAIEGAKVIRQLQPDVTILDHMMPLMDYLEAIKLIRPLIPNGKLIFRYYNFVQDYPRRDAALAAGADTWMDFGPFHPNKFPSIIRRAYYGDDVPSPTTPDP